MDEVAPGVFVATAELYVTTTTVVAGADGGCLVIDPAVTVAELDDARRRGCRPRGLRPVAGWSTHPHWDHVLWSSSLGDDVDRYATPRAVEVAARELPGLVSGMEEAAPGHDLALFARLAPLAEPEIPWRGPRATVLAHDAHAPGHGAVFLPDTGVLVAGDMCSDTEIPLLGMESAETDPFGRYRHGLGVLADVPGVRVVVPGTVTSATPRSSGGGSPRTSATWTRSRRAGTWRTSGRGGRALAARRARPPARAR